MAKGKTTNSPSSSRPSRPALSIEARQNQLVAKAVDLAERQLDEGTASSQVITHFLKLGTVNAEIEREKLRRETELLRAKTEALESTKRVEELYADAIKAMASYNGQCPPEEFDGDY